MNQPTCPAEPASRTRRGARHEPALEPIAIIGLGCRFPGGANSPKAFWDMLCDGGDAISEVPPDRWNADRFFDPDGKPGTAVTRWGGFIDQEVDRFDALFFGMSPREASHLDPMQRWLLEVSWEALEDAGLVPAGLAGSRTGVFIGAFTEDIKLHQLREANRALIGPHTGTGVSMTMVANRLSHFLDLRGPSVSLDTACSSSLVALHLACQSLWNGESSLALAGGVNAMFTPEYTIAESRAGMLSPDGRCKAFDASANGYVRGEGAGVVVLKRLAEAERDEDRIHALIRGTGVNQDGKTQGITVPNGEAQEALIREVCARAGVDPRQVRYTEAHGTGTPVGDPIEARALSNVLGEGRPASDKCIVGSVKTNIGHLEAAAGVAGLIKATLCLEHRQIPPHLHFRTPNPDIPLDQMAIRVPRSLESWPEEEGPALAAVNSFGFGGANAHALLAAAPAVQTRPTEGVRAQLVPISARSPEALAALAARFREHVASRSLASPPEGTAVPLAGFAASAALRRSHHAHRLAAVAHDHEELVGALDAFAAGEEHAGVSHGKSGQRRLAFIFSGMGPQWWAMGRELLDEEPLFRATIERCDELLAHHADWSLLAELTADEDSSRMAETWLSQPANFAVQVGLVELLRSWGIEADGVAGHSTGEAAAMWAAGVLSLEAAIQVMYHRSRLQHTTSGYGKLVALGVPQEEAKRAMAGHEGVSIAAVNSPGAVTLSGTEAALVEVVRPLEESGAFVRFLRVEVPFHSHFMDGLGDELLAALADLEPASAAIPFYSTVTAALAEGPELDSGYWFRNVREPVLFAATVKRLLADGYDTFLEIGPHPVLGSSIHACLQEAGESAEVLSTLRRKTPERFSLLGALGRLYTLGLPVRWEGVFSAGRRYVELPTYAWQRESYWDESAAAAGDRLGAAGHPLLGRRLADAHPTWQAELDGRTPAYLRDHRIQGVALFPGAGYVEMAIASLREAFGEPDRVLELESIRFVKALFLPQDGLLTVQLGVDPENLSFDLRSRRNDEEWSLHAAGTVLRTRDGGARPVLDLDAVHGRCRRSVDLADGYARLHAMGFEYGPLFRGLEELWIGDREALARVELPAPLVRELDEHHLHPTLLDGCFQALILLADDSGEGKGPYMPVTIDRMVVYGRARESLRAHLRLTRWDELLMTGDLTLTDDEGRTVAVLEGVTARSVESGPGAAAENIDGLLLDVEWQPCEMPAPETATAGRWVIFEDHGGFGAELAARAEARGRDVFRVRAGDRFAAGAREAVVRPGQPEDFDRLLAELARVTLPAAMVHLWSLDAPGGEEVEAAVFLAAQDAGPVAVLHLVQALGRCGWRDIPQLNLVTRGVHLVPGDAALAGLAQSPLWGFGRTLFHQEHLELRGRLIDLDPASPAEEAGALAEWLEHGGDEDQLALRGGRAFKARMMPGPVRQAAALIPQTAPRWRADGAYLITGGLGGLGLTIARWFVEHGARRLILMGRTPLGPRESWDELDPRSDAARRIQAVRELERLGASIHLAAVDVSDGEALGAYLARYRREGWPPIRGVLHSAGGVRACMSVEMEAEDVRWALAPKLLGGWQLHRLLRDEPLEFFVLMSSLNAFGMTMGLSGYAAANSALDGLANYRRARGEPAMSVNWGAWSEVGMATDEKVARGFTDRGFPPLTPAQGLRALGRLFELDRVQLVVTPSDWTRVASKCYPLGPPPFVSTMVARAAEQRSRGTEEARRDRAWTPTDPGQRRQALVDQVSKTLGLDAEQLDVNTPLTRLGLDSLLAVELRNRLRNTLGVDVALVKLLQGHNVDQLATDVLTAGATAKGPEPILPGRAHAGEELPLSYGQKTMWLEYLLDRESWAYNALSAVRILSPLDVDAFRDALQELLDRHATLRTTYAMVGDDAVQKVHPGWQVPLEVIDAAEWDPAQVDARMLREARSPFDLENGPVMRAVLFRRSPSEHNLILVAHHIAVDFLSLAIVFRELEAVYPAKVAGDRTPFLPVPELSYTDYVLWQQEMLAGSEGKRLEAFWKGQLAGALSPLELPFDRPRPKLRTLHGAAEACSVDARLTGRLRGLAEERQTTLYTILLAAFQVLLMRLSGQEKIVVCSPMAGRTRSELAPLVGYFVQMVPLVGDLSGSRRFSELLEQTQGTVVDALEHQEYPALLMVRLAAEGREDGQVSLFDIGLVVNAATVDQTGESHAVARPGARWRLAGLDVETLELPQQAGQFDFGLELSETGETLSGMLQYKPELFDGTTVQRLWAHFRTLLEAVTASPQEPVAALPLLTRAERHQLLVELPAAGGHPVAGERVYVVDERLRSVPLGCTGRIAVSVAEGTEAAPGVAGETAARWVPDPFADRAGQRLHLTAKTGRFTASGVLELASSGPALRAPVLLPGEAEAEFEKLADEIFEELDFHVVGEE